MFLRFISFVLSVLTLAVPTYGSFFLDQGIGVKGMQLGGAYSANPNCNEAIYWNVGKLALLAQNETYTMYSRTALDQVTYSLITNFSLSPDQALGLAYYRTQVDNIIYTDQSGTSLGSNFSMINEAYFLSLSQKIGNDLGFGATVKLIQQVAIQQSTFLSCDFGITTTLFKGVHVGLVAQDFASNAPKHEIAQLYRVGLSILTPWASLSLDGVDHQLLKQQYVNAGIDISLGLIEIKGGYSGYDRNFYGGLTLAIQGFRLDYLYTNPDLGSIHKLGLGIIL